MCPPLLLLAGPSLSESGTLLVSAALVSHRCCSRMASGRKAAAVTPSANAHGSGAQGRPLESFLEVVVMMGLVLAV
jgi:hypothetical protein